MSDADDKFRLSGDAATPVILWRGQPVAGFKAGASLLTPSVEPLSGDLLESGGREQLRRRSQSWLDGALEDVFASLTVVLSGSGLTGPARGLVFQLSENLGSMPRGPVADLIDTMGRATK